ncbi:MAG: pantoate--beta-alanine ligase [Bacteroidota bacterium]
MILFKKTADLHKWLDVQQKKNYSIGFIPTMGALHNGHLSLIDASRKENPVTVCSIFVNPTQFNDPNDFEKYPITLEKDIEMLEAAGNDILFLPSVKEMYPDGIKNKIHYNLGYLETILEGKFRPGHFQGVCMVVHRLLDIVQPDNLYLGQKDYQQCMVITKLIELIKQDDKINVNICPTLREVDGLAMSSRNMRLNKEERLNAIEIYHCLSMIKENLQLEDMAVLKQRAYLMLEKKGFKIDYIEIADAQNLSAAEKWDGKNNFVALIAAFMNEVRLIDNMLLN